MADKKISQLPAVTTPLALTEELAAVQSSTTKMLNAVISVISPVAGTFIAAGNLGV